MPTSVGSMIKIKILFFNVIFYLNNFRFIMIKTQQNLRDFVKTDYELQLASLVESDDTIL